MGFFFYILVRRNISKIEKKKSIIVLYDWLLIINWEYYRYSLMIMYFIVYLLNLFDVFLNINNSFW